MCNETTEDKRRNDFLFHMYDQMFNDINRHILVVWQSIGTTVGAFALLILAEKGTLSLDLASALIILLVMWLWAHLIDASYWYNRNLVIIANIERQFLHNTDLQEIHYYWGKHRPNNKMITHLRIQFYLGVGITVTVLLYHATVRVIPGIGLPWACFDFIRALPYIAVVSAGVFVLWLRTERRKNYQEFLQNSPGASVDTSAINFGPGHGFRRSKRE